MQDTPSNQTPAKHVLLENTNLLLGLTRVWTVLCIRIHLLPVLQQRTACVTRASLGQMVALAQHVAWEHTKIRQAQPSAHRVLRTQIPYNKALLLRRVCATLGTLVLMVLNVPNVRLARTVYWVLSAENVLCVAKIPIHHM